MTVLSLGWGHVVCHGREAINDVSGTCADLFESMVLILGTCAIIGVKGSPVSWAQQQGQNMDVLRQCCNTFV